MIISEGSDRQAQGGASALEAEAGFDRLSSAVALQPLTAALLESVTPADVVEAAIARGVETLGAEAGLVVLVRGNEGNQYLDIVGARGYSEDVLASWRRFPLSASLPLSDAVRERTPLFSPTRMELEACYPEMFQRGPMHSVKASVALPLLARGRAFGGLHFSFPAEREVFTEADRAFLDELARQCSLALDRAFLMEEMERARARQEFLSQASTLLAESLDHQTTLESIARLAVPALCDWMTVDVVEGADRNTNDVPTLRLAVAAHIDPTEVEALRRLRQSSPIDMTQTGQPPVAAILSGETIFIPEITPELVAAAARNEEQLRHIKRLDICSLVSVPLRSLRAPTTVVITLAVTHASGRAFTPETVALAEELARRAAIAVDNASLYEEAQREIAERSRAERQAEKIAADLRLITDAAPLLIAYIGADLRYHFVNKGYADWFGYSQSEIVGRSAESVIGSTAFAKVRTRLITALSGEQVFFEETLAYGEGHVRYVHADYVPDRNEDGTVRGVVAVVSDITDRLQAEKAREAALARAETAQHQTQAVLESIGEMFYAIDADFRLTYVNHHVEEAWGKKRSDLLGRILWDVLPQVVGSVSYHAQQEAMRERHTVRFQTISPVLHRWIECSCYPAEEGGISVYFRDIQEQKEAEQALRNSEDRFRALADNIAQLAWMADASGTLFWYNKRWFEYTGTTMDEMKDGGWKKVHHPDYLEAVITKFATHIVSGEPWEDTFPMRGADGQFRWFLSRAFPTRDESGKIVLWCGTNTDITEQREAEAQQRRLAREMLYSLTEGKMRLAETVDDLPPPLAPIYDEIALSEGTLRLLRKQVEAVAEQFKMVQRRRHDLLTAVGEASMNAVKHGRDGVSRVGRVYADAERGIIQVWVTDQGPGIAANQIHRALERGWTTGGFGHGWWFILKAIDRVYLLTGPTGTTVVLEMDRDISSPSWLETAGSL